jgi:uncharacterized protein (TIGR03067 family)
VIRSPVYFCVLIIFCIVSAGRSRQGKDHAGADSKKMQGVWEIEKLEQDGESAADASILRKVIIKDDQFAFRYYLPRSKEEGDLVYRFTLDGSKNPRQMQLSSREESDLPPGIYELDGETLKVCWSRKDPNPPTDFTCPKGSDRRLLVLRRAKAG